MEAGITALVMASITAVSTSAVAIVTVRSWKAQRRREDIDRRNKERCERNKKRWEDDVLSRVEVVNLPPHGFRGSRAMNHTVFAIGVRNRSHLPVIFCEPVFEIRGVESADRTSERRNAIEETTHLLPGQFAVFYREFPWDEYWELKEKEGGSFDRGLDPFEDFNQANPEECKLVDVGPRDY